MTLCCALLALAAWGVAAGLFCSYVGLCLVGGGALAWSASPRNARGLCIAVLLFGLAIMLWGVGVITYDVVIFTHTGDPAEFGQGI